jgi:elongation factor Ts
MAKVTMEAVKTLRERTQAGMNDCKNALTEADGDMDKAIEIIQKKGLAKAGVRAERVATEGEVRTWVSADKKRGVILEVNCQTDFVARGDDFKAFVTGVCEVAQKAVPGSDLNTAQFPGKSDTVDLVRQGFVGKTGENTVIRRWQRIEAKSPNAYVHAYVHMGGKLAVLIEAEAPSADALKNPEFTSFVDNCAMQIAAMSPIVVSKGELTQTQIDKQKEIFQAQLKEEGKPEAAWPKIIEGKIAKWYTEVTLLGQDNVWAGPEAGTVEKIRGELGKKLGGEVKLLHFTRFGLGEGIEKKTDDLAAEVAKLAGG